MKTKLPSHYPFYGLMILALIVTALIVFIPNGGVFADSNVPTVTNSPEPTDTPIPDTPTQGPPTETPDPYPQDDLDNIMGATPVPPSTSESSGGFSTINRILMVCLAVVSVLVVGMIVYLVYRQTRGGSLDDRY